MVIWFVHFLPEVIEFIEIQHKTDLKTDILKAMFQNRLAFLFYLLNELNASCKVATQKYWPTRIDCCFDCKA